MSRKLWTAPSQMFIRGENHGVLAIIFRTLNEYFRKHIGFWAEISGTTDSAGRCVFTISPGFEPSTVLISEFFVDGSAHDMGPFHLHSHSATTLDVHFLTKSGQDRATHAVKISYLCLPHTS